MSLNAFERVLATFMPRTALRNWHARQVLSRLTGYEAANPGRFGRVVRDGRSPDQLVEQSATALRSMARHQERNHDISRGMLRTMVNNVVGANGIGIEPQPRRADGSIHQPYADALRAAFREWARRPDVTGRHTWPKVQRMMARTWIRDGEAFAQELIGNVPGLVHGSRVPFSLELIEPDLVPFEYGDGDRISNGVERNAWGRPLAYWLWRHFPGDTRGNMFTRSDLKRISADAMHHVALLDRIGQTRGVSEFAAVLRRLDDIKNYEESERIAAQIAAAITGKVTRGLPEDYVAPAPGPDGRPAPRTFSLAPGQIIDNLAPGEDIELLKSDRPNVNLLGFRQGQLRAAAAGFGISYSSAARDYNGTYSAQRQELVEQYVNYAVLVDEFTGMFVAPVWETFVRMCEVSGAVPRPADVQPGTEDDALFVAQAMPWIDPLKEAEAWVALVRAGFASEVEAIRKRGASPRDVVEQIRAFRADAGDLVFTADARVPITTGQQAPSATPQEPGAQ